MRNQPSLLQPSAIWCVRHSAQCLVLSLLQLLSTFHSMFPLYSFTSGGRLEYK